MLVLTRRPNRGDNSVIVIGGTIHVEVIGTENGNVQLGITVPDNVQIRDTMESSAIPQKRPHKARKTELVNERH